MQVRGDAEAFDVGAASSAVANIHVVLSKSDRPATSSRSCEAFKYGPHAMAMFVFKGPTA